MSISVHLCLNRYAFVVLEESFDEDRVNTSLTSGEFFNCFLIIGLGH